MWRNEVSEAFVQTVAAPGSREHVPSSTRWQGNPIAPWVFRKTRRGRAIGGQTENIAA